MWPFGGKKKPLADPPALRMTCAAEIEGRRVPVFPLLMPESWTRAPTQVCRPLIKGPKLPNLPVVALVYLIPIPGSPAPNRGFIRTERVDALGKTVREFEEEALHNLSTRPASWKMVELAPGAKIAQCTDDYLAAERILDPVFLSEAGRLLGTTSLLVGVPARGQLQATAFEHVQKNPGHVIAFTGVLEHMFREAGETGITPWPFIVLDGRINSVAEFA